MGVATAIFLVFKANETVHSLLVFAWACFIKPLIHKKTSGAATTKANQQQSLEQFYKSQAHIYDNTREFLLKGRRECLRLAVAHLQKTTDLVWIDIGGGTGSNIEHMNKILNLSKHFKAVYLVDLSPSLCEVATQRCKSHGWTNVHVMVADACDFEIDYKHADLITFSYSLSMIPTFNAAVDNAVSKLDKSGIIASVDFGIQSSDTSMGRINTVGGSINRNIPWILRNFWRIWFEADKVFLDSARRNYLEYKFGTIKSVNCYNKKLGKIPYYIWIGCDKTKSQSILHRLNCLATESPYLAPSSTPMEIDVPISKGHEAALLNFQKNLPFPSLYYQKEYWRVYYDELNSNFEQFKNQYIYAFTWEDPREDHKILNFTSEDTVLAITSAGDNILAYASLPNPPKKIHAVDLNPYQGHLLELKLASFKSLNHQQIWNMFGEGRIDNFTDLLMDKLSPHMSSHAFQYWMEKGPTTFSGKGLYDTGSTRWALRLAKWTFSVFGVTKYVEQLCAAETMELQKKIWNAKIKPALFNPIVATLMVGNPIFLWKALGVPANQASMMGPSVLKYVKDTLDPLINRSLISKDNYFYYLCLMGRYAYNNCPDYLTLKGYKRLTTTNNNGTTPADNIRLHTDTLNDVFDRLSNKSITIAIIMDHMDWFDPKSKEANEEITALKKCLARGGRVMLRSASTQPWYIRTFEEMGFMCEPAAVRESGQSIDRTNMYASTWVCTKVTDDEDAGRRRISSLKI
ncbi:S-adenosyl-L-methionine-dependent methyltransferase [Suhomyces tanzawaensis NRRL Y-17324]|uniref:S-adenosyl-L-methionine-dependent methyltransferase n=1 Tax=Suhomyces tanzawaensis NRRL Y-17324 TaxID=984487 RepID=A0A1E4SDH1_9ASCO|nr:S-adenosyl-L-methionine-dependent methyltransferase [Suhomyces tanzawaensis NRRL Y-17324]ODV77567.1 S-adenosyl-L-methionine-dependent methyltransferase [Suhomyces tanzawaensis NRRL Y-17324]